jgi:hypothetical protein
MSYITKQQYTVIEEQLNHRSSEAFHLEIQRAIRYAAAHDWTTGAACPSLQLHQHGFFFCSSCSKDVGHKQAVAHLASEEHLSALLDELQQPAAEPGSILTAASDALRLLQQYFRCAAMLAGLYSC